jgi:hypothetical protein
MHEDGQRRGAERDFGGCRPPLRLEITKHLKPGANSVRIEPFAPKSARLVAYE